MSVAKVMAILSFTTVVQLYNGTMKSRTSTIVWRHDGSSFVLGFVLIRSGFNAVAPRPTDWQAAW